MIPDLRVQRINVMHQLSRLVSDLINVTQMLRTGGLILSTAVSDRLEHESPLVCEITFCPAFTVLGLSFLPNMADSSAAIPVPRTQLEY
jgi:hypothetical protein